LSPAFIVYLAKARIVLTAAAEALAAAHIIATVSRSAWRTAGVYRRARRMRRPKK
jgi:hypothetical protein